MTEGDLEGSRGTTLGGVISIEKGELKELSRTSGTRTTVWKVETPTPGGYEGNLPSSEGVKSFETIVGGLIGPMTTGGVLEVEKRLG